MAMSLSQFQTRIKTLFGDKDARRGVEGTFMWFMEEVGELSAALRQGMRREGAPGVEDGLLSPAQKRKHELALEFADVLAWLATLANIAEVDLDAAIEAKYGRGCPKCVQTPCVCVEAKP